LAGAVKRGVRNGDEASLRHLTTNVFGVTAPHFPNAKNADGQFTHLGFPHEPLKTLL